MLFDRDVDGILTLPECSTALHTLGRKISGICICLNSDNFFVFSEKELIRRVKEVSIDSLNLTIEFNEFLSMMSNFEKDNLSLDGLIVAFK